MSNRNIVLNAVIWGQIIIALFLFALFVPKTYAQGCCEGKHGGVVSCYTPTMHQKCKDGTISNCSCGRGSPLQKAGPR